MAMVGLGWRWRVVCIEGQSQGGLVTCLSTCRVRDEDTDDARSHRHPGAQLWVWLSRNWSVGLPGKALPQEGSGLLCM